MRFFCMTQTPHTKDKALVWNIVFVVYFLGGKRLQIKSGKGDFFFHQKLNIYLNDCIAKPFKCHVELKGCEGS